MAVVDKLRAIFGWTGASAPPDKPRKGTNLSQTQMQFGVNPFQAYSSTVKPPYDRRRRYDIYDEMDELELVSSILDAYAEDCTQFDREKKASVWVEAADSKVKKIINDMFERVKVEEWIEASCRDVGKYGDDFAELDIEEGIGIVGIDWRDPRDIERIENRQGTLVGFEETKKLKNIAAMLERGEQKITYTYKPWDIVHFRLYRRKREWKQKYRNIYGTSVLAGSERITKQLKILDDMLMVRRLTKTLDTRVYKIDTARSSVEEEVLILKRWRNALKRKTFIDPASTARFDTPFDPFTFQEDVFWPVKEGSNSSVDVIQGQPNVADIVDVEYFRDKFFGSTRAPKAYFGYEGDINAKATLSSQDMKWGRASNAVQRATRNGLTRMAQIELALHNMDATAAKFDIKMVVPSVLEDLSRLEAMQTMIDAAERMAGLGETLNLDSDAWREHILMSVLGMSKQEIKMYSSKGPGDDPSTEPDVVAPDGSDKGNGKAKLPPATAEPTDKEKLEPERLDELLRLAILQRIGRTTLDSGITEHVRRDELPPTSDKRGDAYGFIGGRIVPIAIVEDIDDNDHAAS